MKHAKKRPRGAIHTTKELRKLLNEGVTEAYIFMDHSFHSEAIHKTVLNENWLLPRRSSIDFVDSPSCFDDFLFLNYWDAYAFSVLYHNKLKPGAKQHEDQTR